MWLAARSRLTALYLGLALPLGSGGCLLIGYESHPVEADGSMGKADAAFQDVTKPPKEAGADVDLVPDGGTREPTEAGMDGSLDAGAEGGVVDGGTPDARRPDADAPDASPDAASDAGEGDAERPDECPDGGCTCPPQGALCAGSLWVRCGASGEVAETEDCASLSTVQCTQGVCVPDLGCVIQEAPEGTPCDDGLFCTATDVCQAGACVGMQDPCGDTACLNQHCNEAGDICRVDGTNVGAPCGPSATCGANGSCVDDENCTGACAPACEVEGGTCDLQCQDAQSCDVTCYDDQICNIDCENTQECHATCNELIADCNLDCSGATECEGTCLGGDCALECDGTESCLNICEGRYSVCTTDCDGSQDCDTRCDDGARCVIEGCDGGNCEASCRDDSRCEVDCRGATSCVTRCASNSRCEVDCRTAESCELDCSLSSRCILRCSPGAPDCRLTDCLGGAASCPDGSLVCHAACP